MRNGGMIGTLVHLKGNQRACVWVEPLWGIPYYLFIPFASLYMGALGLSSAQIGYVASLSLGVQVLSSVVSGVLSDKLGRRLCNFIGEFVCWSAPLLLWALAQGPAWFVAAGMLNGMYRITMTSWTLLMTEGSDSDTVVKCFSLVQFMGLLAAFFAPLSKLGVDRFGLVPMMRILYGAAFVLITLKAFLLYYNVVETKTGEMRMAATRSQSAFSLLWGCRGVLKGMLHDKKVLYALGILASYHTVRQLTDAFWALFLVNRLGIPHSSVALFVSLRSIVVLLSIIVLVPRLRVERFARPMMVAWGLFAAAQGMLLMVPVGGAAAAMVVASTILEAVALSILVPMTDSLLIVNADKDERARVVGLVYAVMLLPVAVFPAVAGYFTRFTIAAPFWINMGILLVGALLTMGLWRAKERCA